MVIHVDGSREVSADRNTQVNGWALVACHDGEFHERSGAIVDGKFSPLGSMHEQIAFVHAALYADQAGYVPAEVTIVCDDEIFGHGAIWLHEGNYLGRRANQVRTRLQQVAKHAFHRPEDQARAHAVTMRTIQGSIVHKVKGHSQSVHQERVDYLAKHAAQSAAGVEIGDHLSYDDWIDEGLKVYDRETEAMVVWRAAFSRER